MDTAVEARHLSKRYGDLVAVQSLSLRIPRGSIYGLVGANGAGKTTTLRMLATVTTPSAGWATVCGYDVESQAQDVRRRVGWLPDPPGAYGELRVGEYLRYFADLYRIERPAGVVGDVLALTGLEDCRRRYVSELSRGTVQRLGLARCLLHRPEVFLLDEPASALDPRGRVELLAFLREIRAMGSTVVLSSHVLPDLEEICDGLALIESGRVVAQGSLEDLRRQLGGRDEWELRPGGDPDAAMETLRGIPGVSCVTPAGDVVRFTLAGGPEERARLLQALVDAGIPVAGLREAKVSLERLFLSLTVGGGR